LFDVVRELYAEWSIIPGAAEAAIDFGRGKNEAAPLRERYDGVDVGCSHEYRINRIREISKTHFNSQEKAQNAQNEEDLFALLCLFVASSYLLGV
jgi:hypothetical protein